MVEKLPTTSFREPYQKHQRNVSAFSTISDISTFGGSDPLKRDEKSEIKCVLLCDSEHEKNCMLESFNKCLSDGESSISDLQLLDFCHWEQPKNENGCVLGGTPENLAHDCRHCLSTRSVISGTTHYLPEPQGFGGLKTHSRNNSGTHTSQFNSNFSNSDTPKYYFRFNIESTFRLLLLSKDKQNYLKTMTFDFLLVGAQVDNKRGKLDMNIWEFEWKRLERHSRKSAAPIILLGYFRNILSLNSGTLDNFSLDKVLEDTRSSMQKEAIKHKVIPKFCDLQTGTSTQLAEIFSDVDTLYKNPGYLLQQCAYYNNIFHFTKIIESPGLTGENLCYVGSDSLGDNPIMIAAKLRHKDLVCALLRSNKFQEGCQEDNKAVLNDLIHMRNKVGDSLLAMVALQGPELEEQKLLILKKEIQLHVESRLTHEADQIKLQRCLRGQLKSSAEAAIVLEQVRALQGMPKTEHELKMETCKVWTRLFFSSLLLSLLFNLVDNGSDILIMIRYYNDYMRESNGKSIFGGTNSNCGDSNRNEFNQTTAFLNCINCTCTQDIPLDCITENLSSVEKFGYTLLFLLLPWPFFIYEFFTSDQWCDLRLKGHEIIKEMSECKSINSLLMCYLRAMLYFAVFLFCFILWPVAVLFIKYYNDAKYYLARGPQKAAREKRIEASEVLFSTARVMEVSLESSFQPTIQLYIMFPQLMKTFKANTFSLTIATFCTGENKIPMLKTDQTISIITSIVSLAWCFSYYHATLKRGALDKDLAALFYRAVLFLSVLFQILGRIFIFVLFSYSFGKGMYYPLLVFLGAHILLMSILHFVFSDAKVYWQKGGFLKMSFLHYIVGNGLANIYIHNWIRMDPLLIPFKKPLQHVSTLCRQLMFDLVFISENIILLGIALNSEIKELKDNKVEIAIILMGFCILGLILKCVYYRYLHLWAWLIMDYITEVKDGHWSCTLISNMYFMGNLKNRKLILCCLPSPLFALTRFLFGEKRFESTDTHCSRCSCVFTILFTPVIFALALVIVAAIITLVVAFLPIYFVLVLPCVLYQLIRKEKSGQNVVRKFLNIEDADMVGSRDDVYKGGDVNCQGEGIPLTNDHLKSRLNTRRASSIEGENEMIETPVSEERSNKDNGILHLDTNNTKDLLFTENEKVDIHNMNKLPADAKLVSVTKPCTEQIVVA